MVQGLGCGVNWNVVGWGWFSSTLFLQRKVEGVFELGFSMALLGFLWLLVAFALGMWRNGVLLDVPRACTFIGLSFWVVGCPALGVGFWLAIIGAVI